MKSLSEHQKRWATALIGLAILAASYFLLGYFAIVIITGFLSITSFYEWLNIGLTHSEARLKKLRFSIIVGLLVILITAIWQHHQYVFTFALISFILLNLFYAAEGSGQKECLRDLCFQSFGLIYMIGFFCMIPQIHLLPQGQRFLLLLLICIWSTDTGAYYGGKTFGKRRLAPHLSPNKTIEGSISGLLIATIACVLFAKQFISAYSLFPFLILGALTSFLAQAGDLFESLFKRVSGVKDSGTILPGHGGVFDRFDSLILSAPFFYIYLRWFII